MLTLHYDDGNKDEVRRVVEELGFQLTGVQSLVPDSNYIRANVVTKRESPEERELIEAIQYIPRAYALKS